ncbi:hypothetical protein HZ989_08085 [Brevundimonas sp. AJA228-03]|uniref:hypothetical protein n=1 Tax=Brevundimonas sp. AJA228-03 TaxID=2752515 RepID=UPI001ADEF2A6|nr:hypothetical protein [Brevundimonas sp. AJA228-03]QTN18252.1 hypothetical protein HZ989_08085 [Brevundimonas sp. AJA228-03]
MLIGLVAALALGSGQARDPAPTILSDIIVNAPPNEARALGFIDRVAAPPSGRRLARWERSLCVSVAGLDAAYAQFIVDRVTAVGASVGLDPGQAGCRPDVLIIFTADPDAAAGRLIDEDLETFRPVRYGATDRGEAALEQFQHSDAPVRWWHVSAPVSILTGEVMMGMEDGPAIMNAPNASRIGASTREALQRAIIIVDANQIRQVSFGALGEYLGVVTLAQVEPGADLTGYQSVLNLFAGSPGQRITDWDQSYLQALYRARGDQLRYVQQATDIAERMAERAMRSGTMPDSGESRD